MLTLAIFYESPMYATTIPQALKQAPSCWASKPGCSSPGRGFIRNGLIALVLAALHVAVIWVLQCGQLMGAATVVVPVKLLAHWVEAPAAKAAPAQPLAPKPSPAQHRSVPVLLPPLSHAPIPPTRLAPTEAFPQPAMSPQPHASVSSLASVSAVAPLPEAVKTQAVTAQSAVMTQLPSSDAAYLNNPEPRYPPISRNLKEQGKTIVRVLIDAEGQPQKAEIFISSGFKRLDQAAMAAVMRWRFVPGKRNGVAESMSVNVPIHWVLND